MCDEYLLSEQMITLLQTQPSSGVGDECAASAPYDVVADVSN
jgi:hypothetical protein